MNCGLTVRRRKGAAGVALLLVSVWITAPLRGAVIFTDVPDVNLMAGGFGGEVFYNVDLNNDGIHEVQVAGRFGDFYVTSYTTTKVAGISAQPPDVGGFAHPFVLSDSIYSQPPENRSWNSGISSIIGCQEIGCIGLWTAGGTNYVGVEFQLETGIHYGWIAIEMQFIFGGGHLLSYAYESEPNRPIVAGAIPEPSTAMLVGTGTALLLKRNVKTRKENKALQRTARGLFVSTLFLICRCLGFGGAQPRP